MKHAYKTATAILLSLLVASLPVFADDALDFDSFFDEASPAASDGTLSGSPALTINGEAKTSARVWVDEDSTAVSDLDDSDRAVQAIPSLRLDLFYEDDASELNGKLLLDSNTLTTYPEDIIQELTYKAYLGDFVLSVGKSKVVWGRGDKLHVLDLINADDYSDFMIPDYIDRRLAEPMVDVTWNMPNNMSLAAVWTPFMTPDRVPTEGVWEPQSAKDLMALGTTYVTNMATKAYAAAMTEYASLPEEEQTAKAQAAAFFAGMSAASTIEDTYGTSDAFLPDTHSLKYSQYGLRWTGTFGPVDLGVQYYLGHYKTPSVKATYTGSDFTGLSLDYDRLQAFGIDAAGVAGPFNLRGELAYYLTDDIDGDDPSVHNNSLEWLGGFDIDLPVNEMNLNVQLIGSYILGNDDIAIGDVDYNSAEKWSNDKLVVELSDSYDHEKLSPSITAIWGIERQDFMLMPKIEYQLKDGFTVAASGAWITSGTDGEFYAYKDNSFVELKASYRF